MKFLKKFATRAEYDAFMVANNDNSPFVGYIADEKKVEYVSPVNYAELPLHFIALEDMTVSFTTNPIQYSLDNETWVVLPVGESTPTIAAGDKVYFKAKGLSPTSSGGIGAFNIVGRCNVRGNAMSLLYGDDFIDAVYIKSSHSFFKLFYNQTAIIHAGNLVLPATSLASSCYSNMFTGCTSLTNAPALPATTLASDCYKSMFYGCTSLTNAPALPATTLANSCYIYIFRECSSLVNAPELPATTLASSCYYGMFWACTSLVNAPELPATTLASSCYSYMFFYCSSLQYIKAMFTTAPSSDYMSVWVTGVKSVGTFVKNAAATWTDSFGTSAIPTGWTVETATE